MSNRYGRSQKQAHRTEIAYLKRRLYRESTHRLYIPAEGVPDLDTLATVKEYSTTEEGSLYGMVQRSACVTIVAPSSDLLNLIYERPIVQFRGTQYLIADISMDCVASVYGASITPTSPSKYYSLDLVGVA